MSGIISFRTTKVERRQLKAWTAQRGFKTMSEFIRTTLGFELGLPGTESIQEIDELDNFESLAKALAYTTDQIVEMRRDINAILRHLGANRDLKLPEHQKPKPSRAEVTIAVTTAQLPEGFAR